MVVARPTTPGSDFQVPVYSDQQINGSQNAFGLPRPTVGIEAPVLSLTDWLAGMTDEQDEQMRKQTTNPAFI